MSDMDYLAQIQQLVELQKIDDDIFAVKGRLENAPRNVSELEERFQTVEGRRDHVLDKIAHLKDQKKRVERDIEDDTARIKKSKNKLMQVGKDREYQAMLREIDSIEKNNRNREEEKVTLLEELRTQTGILEEIDKEYEIIKAERDEKRDSLDDTMKAAYRELDELGAKRSAAARLIPQPIFMRYEFIRNRLEHPVIVDVDDGICSGCHIAIPPQDYIDLQCGQKILSCPNCQRLIFWGEHFGIPPRAKPAKKQKIVMDDSGLDDEDDREEMDISEAGIYDDPENGEDRETGE